MNFFILFLVGTAVNAVTAVNAMHGVNAVRIHRSVLGSARVSADDFDYNNASRLCIQLGEVCVSRFLSYRDLIHQDQRGCWPVAISMQEQCRLTLSTEKVSFGMI